MNLRNIIIATTFALPQTLLSAACHSTPTGMAEQEIQVEQNKFNTFYGEHLPALPENEQKIIKWIYDRRLSDVENDDTALFLFVRGYVLEGKEEGEEYVIKAILPSPRYGSLREIHNLEIIKEKNGKVISKGIDAFLDGVLDKPREYSLLGKDMTTEEFHEACKYISEHLPSK